MRILVFNAGSSSLKFELIEVAGVVPRRLATASFAADDVSGRFRFGARSLGRPIADAGSLGEAAERALAWLASGAGGSGNLLDGLDATAHRIVHGGERFRETAVLDDAGRAALATFSSLAPLHNPPALAVIDAVRRRVGASLPLVGVFDTAYYTELEPAAYRYAVPSEWSDALGVRRYGFHGIAHRYLSERAQALHGGAPDALRIISLQLGRGCSVTASRGSRPVATSMGFTPLEGLVMGTRSGDIHAGAVLYVMEKTGLSPAAMRQVLNERSGLLGLSGRTADMRELLDRKRAGDGAAALAIEVFCRRARHYVGAYLAELGGADVIAFGGGIGENCPDVRRQILTGLEWAGIHADDPARSATAMRVIPVDEAAIIAAEAYRVLAPARLPESGA